MVEAAPTVLIVGSGPAGLFAACELMRHGVRPRVVERRQAPHHETRGTGIQPAVLETIHRAGLVESFLDSAVHVKHIQLLGPGLREIARADFAGIGCAYEFQCSLPQWRTEQILRDRLESVGLAIEFGTEVVSIEDDPAGLRVALDRGGETEIATVAYVLGAGGAHSVTRHSMQEHLAGETYGGRYVVADVKISLTPPHESSRVAVGPAGFALFAPLPEDRWLIFVNRDEVDTDDLPPAEAELAAMLDARLGCEVGLRDVRWVSFFRMHRRVARTLSDGRRFLLGDAAHLSSPLGGEGVNAALMDAANIAWKLALVLRGEAKPLLLDSYATERGMADAHVLDVSNEVHKGVMDMVAMCADGGVPSLPQIDAAQALAVLRRRTMLDISYAGSALIGHAEAGMDAPMPGERFPGGHLLDGTRHHLIVSGAAAGLDDLRTRWGRSVSIVEASGFDAANAGLAGGGAVLVRPDGFIGFRAASACDGTMAALDAHLASYLVPA